MRTSGRLAALVFPLIRLADDNIFRHKTSCHGQCFQNIVKHPLPTVILSDHCRTASSMMIPYNTMDFLIIGIMAVPSFVFISQDCMYSDLELQAELFNRIAHVFLDIIGLPPKSPPEGTHQIPWGAQAAPPPTTNRSNERGRNLRGPMEICPKAPVTVLQGKPHWSWRPHRDSTMRESPRADIPQKTSP